MAIFRTQFERINFDFDPPLRQVSDVVFEVDADEYTEDNYHLFGGAAGEACGKQNPHWSNYESPIEGYAGWSSVLSCGEGYTKVEDTDLDFDLGTPGEGKARIAETFVSKDRDPTDHDWSNSWRVTGFYKTYVPPEYDDDIREPMEQVTEILAELREEELAGMSASQRLREEQKTKVVQCSREEAEYVAGSGLSGTIRRLEDIVVTGRVNWEDRTIARNRRDYKIHADRPTEIWMYWLKDVK